MADVQTTIRIDADTKAAVAELGRMDAAMNIVSRRASPALGAAFGSLSSQALSMTTGLSGVSGVMSIVGQTALTISPILGGVAIAAAAATTMFLKKKDAVAETTEVLKLNDAALVGLITNNTTLAGILKNYHTTILAGLRLEEQETQAKLAKLGFTEQEIVEMEKLGFAHIREAEAEKFANAEIRKEFEQTAARLAQIQERIKALTATAQTASRFTGFGDAGPMSLIADQIERQAENAQKLLDIETQRAQLRGRSAGGDVFDIIATSNEIIAAETVAYESRLAAANAFDGSRQVIEAQFTLFLEGELARRDEAVRRSLDAQAKEQAKKAKEETRIKQTAAQEQLRASAQTAAQMLILQNASLRETISAVIAEQQARLASLAIVAAVEAVYYSITNPAIAATKWKAAAMAGAGAIALGAVGSAFDSESASRMAGSEVATGGGSSRSQSSGRTLVSQGPVTLYYNQTIVVHGSILDKGDFFSLWNDANMQYLRTAFGDATARA